MIRKFKAETNEEYGSLGWKPLFVYGDPYTDMAIPHDILEHFPGDSGSCEEELMALGAMVLIRGLPGHQEQFNPRSTVKSYENIGGGILEIAWSMLREDIDVKQAPSTYKREEEVEHFIQMAVSSGIQSLSTDLEPEDKKTVQDRGLTYENCLSWMRIGYSKAAKRYKGLDPTSLSYLFEDIRKQSNKLLDNAYEGQVMVVDIERKHYQANCYIEEEDYDSY